ncbi:MAG TPA: bifunctional demethylmenaquinone methyltransferase/2-methoxy-6-polyprenyl-1,4-benzoquinol methylase UbiE [Rubricoccaceae bacterium]|nr:bifunctional demethylmenaquinone methyltransferase/2-methoxy-6-polyprenyl-1,4-benzoquinol methylase UbiE [Rubricoccaceae bacterium]
MTKPPIGQGEGKAAQVEAMFDAIAPRYDLLNRVLSFGTDVWWRRRAVAFLKAALPGQPAALLDVATGTADLALALLRLGPERVVGVDLSEGMLALGRAKVARRGQEARVSLVQGDAAALPFADDTFDGATAGFGVRNFEDLRAGLAEIRRVLRPGAPLVVLEFSHPRAFPVKQLYRAYSRHVLPRVGRAVSKNPEAYEYLPESVAAFPDGEAFLSELRGAGFREPTARPLTFGIASLYRGRA